MKTKTLLLAGLSAVLLASCGDLKSYKTEVKMETFISTLEKLEENSPLLDKNPYSFVFEQKQEQGYDIIYSQNNKEISKAVKEEKSKSKIEFDVINSVIAIKASSEEEYEDPTYEKETIMDYDRVQQKDNKNVYEVDKKSKTYTKEVTSDPEKSISTTAMAQGLSLISAFKYHVSEIGKDGKYYIDGDTYTVVLDKTEEKSSITKRFNTICQLTVKNDSYEYYYKDVLEIEELHRKDIDKDLIVASFKKKSLNLNSIDLHEYLEVEELDFPAI